MLVLSWRTKDPPPLAQMHAWLTQLAAEPSIPLGLTLRILTCHRRPLCNHELSKQPTVAISLHGHRLYPIPQIVYAHCHGLRDLCAAAVQTDARTHAPCTMTRTFMFMYANLAHVHTQGRKSMFDLCKSACKWILR